MKKVKVFVSGKSAHDREAGKDLDKQILDWEATFPVQDVNVEDVHTTCSNYGWMVTITYTLHEKAEK